MADASGDARANAATGLPRSRGLRCCATRARDATRPNDKTASKHSRQLLFSEAIAQPKAMRAQTASQGHTFPPVDQPALDATDRILQEIASVGRRLEAMDLKITDLTLASSSIRADIAGFKETANNLDQHLLAVEDHIATTPDQEEELKSLRAKLTELED
ncbi:hypothetical protein NDU88_007731 [Pleurodeles waltl]|uniref:Uncharacterized protein n=1 Tax=Pleurodeles waltl TaxID=8319 RepID=A0AAV7U3Z6_PLEWA|nr:hypothetical protein NDU88_007731 [Pleurodeles waltl]